MIVSAPVMPSDSPDTEPCVVDLRALTFRYRPSTPVSLELDALRLRAGETLFVHGPSGSGKSTLLSLLAGVLLAQKGEIALLDVDWHSLGAAARDRRRGDHVGYIFQQFNLLPWLPVIDNVTLACRFSARRAKRACARDGSIDASAKRWLLALGLGPDRWPQPAATLSVGEQQRVAAARALMGEPELMLADEPTSALDAGRRDQFMTMLLAACADASSALVLVSHDRALDRHFQRALRIGGE